MIISHIEVDGRTVNKLLVSFNISKDNRITEFSIEADGIRIPIASSFKLNDMVFDYSDLLNFVPKNEQNIDNLCYIVDIPFYRFRYIYLIKVPRPIDMEFLCISDFSIKHYLFANNDSVLSACKTFVVESLTNIVPLLTYGRWSFDGAYDFTVHMFPNENRREILCVSVNDLHKYEILKAKDAMICGK